MMNEIQNKDTRTPIEIALDIDENGMITARKLYEFLELNPSNYSKWYKTNITENTFATENEDYFINSSLSTSLTGRGNTQDFKLTAHFAKKLSCKGNGEKAEQAREYFTTIEERVKQKAIDIAQLNPQTQLMYTLMQSIINNELEQKRQAEQIKSIKAKQDAMEQKQETITNTFQKVDDTEYFQKLVNKCIVKIAESSKYDKGQNGNSNYQLARQESYERLKQKRNCRLDDRVQKAIGRAIKEKPDIKKSDLHKINKLYIIAHDKDLKPAYELVIKEMMLCYC